MSNRIEHHIGERFGRLSINSLETRQDPSNPKKIQWSCLCDCGDVLYVRGHALRSGRTKSCGCLALELKRAKKGTPTKYVNTVNSTPGRFRAYRSWEKMKGRCLDTKSDKFKDYGARGISICARWLDSFDNFFNDMGERAEGMTLGRKDNDRNYEPDNCRWETISQQANNKRNTKFIQGKPLTIFCKDKRLSAPHVRTRLALGWDETEAVETPVAHRPPTQ